MPFQQRSGRPEFRQYFLVGHPIFDPSAHARAMFQNQPAHLIPA
jgi:hypothetical protein